MNELDKFVKMQKEFKKLYDNGILISIETWAIHVETSYFLEKFQEFDYHFSTNTIQLSTRYKDIQIITVFDKYNLKLCENCAGKFVEDAKQFFKSKEEN